MISIQANIPGYQVSEELYNGSRIVVYRGYRDDQKPVAIKLLKNPYPSFGELLQFRNQYTIAKNLKSPLIIQTYSLEPYQNGYVLVMEFGGISLKDYFTNVETLDVTFLIEFLLVAIALCNTLDILYRTRIIHKDIKPANILINPETKQVKLIDFSIASLLPRETQTLVNPNVLEGTLAYISPEQTGRMNRGIDYRTDFYSLGVTFYELLTGELPFQSNDPMELIHCHIAKLPPNLRERGKDIPQVLGDIVMKLMAKNAEDRYQSALGLKFDLENCLHQLKYSGKIESFPIAQHDLCDRFIIPDKLYGRETEVETLLQAFERVSTGATEMILVAGFSGIGKTAVVNEVHKPIVRQRGYFIKGKYDQFQRNIPFSAFVQAFRDLMGQLAGESNIQIQEWKIKILEAVGENGQVIIEVIPELERIIGQQPPAPELSGTAAQNRFNLLFQKFTQVFTSAEHPLVIFLDDLQWADSASLKLMQLLMADTKYLFLIGAYRDNEVNPAHTLMLTLSEMQKMQVTINTITLAPLSQSKVNQLVVDTLKCTENYALPLSQLVAQKTKGNPFFATQFLKALHQDRLIQFDFESGCWQCDITQVSQQALADDIVAFMAFQLQRLPQSTQNALQLAACIGNQFDLATLAIVSEESEIETASNFWKALQEGLILPISDVYKFYQEEGSTGVMSCARTEVGSENVNELAQYRFLHDRVQQAAYSLIPNDQKQAIHLKIGQLLLQNSSEIEKEEKLFDIVGHLNLGSGLITQPSKRIELAKLNLIAGQRAKLSTAYESAAKYLALGLEYLPKTKWDTHYELTLFLYLESIEAEFLAGNFDQAKKLTLAGLSNAKSNLDQTKFIAIQLTHYQNKALYQEAIHVGIEGLKLLGLELPILPDEASLEAMGLSVKQTLNQREVAGLLYAPLIVDEERKMLINLLMNLVPPTYLTNQDLLVLVVLHMTNICLKYGNTNLAGFVYVWYGTILCQRFQDYELGYNFGLLALKVNEKFNNTSLNGKIYMSFGNFVNHWRKHVSSNLALQKVAYQGAMEAGDFSWCHHSALFSFWQQAIASSDINNLLARHEKYISFAKQTEITTALALILQCKLLENLQGLTKNRDGLSSVTFDEESTLATFNETGYAYGSNTYYFAKAFLFFTYGEYAKAYEMLVAAEQSLNTLYGQFQTVLYYFYQSLSVLQLYGAATEQQKQIYQEIFQKNREQMQLWADNCPENFLSKYLLLEAEIARVAGEKWQASEFYDRAITGAKENGYIQEEALANELAAKFYLDCSKKQFAQIYITNAYYCYARWGAKAKVEDLEKRYPELLTTVLKQPQISLASTTIFSSSTSISDTLDLTTVLKASQALSSEIELEQLLSTLMQVIMENAGADKCVLILVKGNNLIIEATESLKEADTTIQKTLRQSIPVESSREIPISLINYVSRTSETLVIDDVIAQTSLASDPYFLIEQPKSLLCTPVSNQGKLIGILYLENNLSAGAFTRDRLQIIKLLTNQAAISLENAQLYGKLEDYSHTLEQKVEERTQELTHSCDRLQSTLEKLYSTQTQLIQAEKMSGLGQLVAGIAHEINNPISFIYGNLEPASQYVTSLIELNNLYQQLYPQPLPEIEEKIARIDLEFLVHDLQKLLESMKVGAERICQIVLSLRNFSRLDEAEIKPVDIHSGIDSTLLILQHRLQNNSKHPPITVIQEYGQLPLVNCYPSALNQVFMNILSNAIDALKELNANYKPTIIIRTELQEQKVLIRIADNGVGMSESVKNKIFNPFFTTKPIGSGTGLGLSISYSIVVEKHRGQLSCISAPGEGTEFVIEIPV